MNCIVDNKFLEQTKIQCACSLNDLQIVADKCVKYNIRKKIQINNLYNKCDGLAFEGYNNSEKIKSLVIQVCK